MSVTEKLGKISCPKCRAGEDALLLAQAITEYYCVEADKGVLALAWTDTDYSGTYTLCCHKCGHEWPLPKWIAVEY